MTIAFEFYFLAKLMSLGFGILPLPSSTGSLININDKKKLLKKFVKMSWGKNRTIEFEFYFLAKLMSLDFGILPLPSSTGSLIE